MATTTTPIIFKITEAGKLAAISASTSTPKVKINLTQVVIGSGKYTPNGKESALKSEFMRSALVSGDVEADSNTLRFSSDIVSLTSRSVYEVGLLTDTGVLFAVAASSSDSLFTVHPDITFVASFGLSLDEVGVGNVKVTTDPNGTLALVIMENHLAAPDPHPQYLNNDRFQFAMRALYPVGYHHHSHEPVNPKPIFDDILGIDTAWRRITGRIMVASDPNDSFISDHSIVLGQRGMTDLASSGQRPHVYPLQTTHLFERYDPNSNIETVWNIKASRSSVTEGGGIRFTVTANNLPDGQALDWTIKEGVLNSANNDITSPEQTKRGSVTIKNGQAVIDFTTTPDDNEAESKKHVRVTVAAPANLSLNVPINDLGKNETILHINASTNAGIVLDEYYNKQAGSYPKASDKIRFIVDKGVDVVAPNTSTPAILDGVNWPSGSQIIVENRGRILGRGGDGGRSAYQYKFFSDNGEPLQASPSNMRNPQKGGNGGTAIKSSTRAIFVENHSIIAGGGGGGGGLGAYKTGGSYNFIVGGGGTGGGAPFGNRSPNEGTYTMYLQDEAVTDLKLPLPDNGRFYKILLQKESGAVANWSGSSGDYSYGPEYRASDINETRAIFVEATATSDRLAIGNFRNYRIAAYAGYLPQNAIVLNMSQSASLNTKGLGGANLSIGTSMVPAQTSAYPDSDNPTFTQGGDGGAIGENGDAGMFDKIYRYSGTGDATETTSSNTSWYIPPADGGLAGYVKQGSVTINNLSGGTTKGR